MFEKKAILVANNLSSLANHLSERAIGTGNITNYETVIKNTPKKQIS